MEALKIELSLSGKDYLDLAFEDGKKSFFTYAPAKKYFKYLFILILLMVIMGFASYSNAYLAWTLVLIAIGILSISIALLTIYSRYASWKTDVKKYAKELDSNPFGSIELHENYLHYTHGSTKIEKWSDVNQILINDRYIHFSGRENQLYIILKTSMPNKQFDQITEWMKQKMV